MVVGPHPGTKAQVAIAANASNVATRDPNNMTKTSAADSMEDTAAAEHFGAAHHLRSKEAEGTYRRRLLAASIRRSTSFAVATSVRSSP